MTPRPALSSQALQLCWALDPPGFIQSFRLPPALGAFVLCLYQGMPGLARERFHALVPRLIEEAPDDSAVAFGATDCAIRELLPSALAQAGLLEREAFGYLRHLHPVEDRDTAHLACLAAWDACVALERLRVDGARPTALEARYAATDARFGAAAWAPDCARHAALAAQHHARQSPEAAWNAALDFLGRMLGPAA